MACRSSEARLSICSGAPSLQPSLAPTYESQTPSNRSSYQHCRMSARLSGPPGYYETYPFIMPEKLPATHAHPCGDNPAAMASTSSLSTSTDPRAADIRNWSGALERMQDARMDKQRYVMSGHKSEEVSILALGAKVERALARRMVGQDASFRVKTVPQPQPQHHDVEKRGLEVKAN